MKLSYIRGLLGLSIEYHRLKMISEACSPSACVLLLLAASFWHSC